MSLLLCVPSLAQSKESSKSTYFPFLCLISSLVKFCCLPSRSLINQGFSSTLSSRFVVEELIINNDSDAKALQEKAAKKAAQDAGGNNAGGSKK